MENFPRPGDACPSCPKLDPPHKTMSGGAERLVGVGTTSIHNWVVAVCPHCDGARLIQIFKDNEK
jgi:hypothetical protein